MRKSEWKREVLNVVAKSTTKLPPNSPARKLQWINFKTNSAKAEREMMASDPEKKKDFGSVCVYYIIRHGKVTKDFSFVYMKPGSLSDKNFEDWLKRVATKFANTELESA